MERFAKSKPLEAFESFEYLQEVAPPEHSMGVQQVRIEVRLPEGHWAGDVTRSHPSAVLRTNAVFRGTGAMRL